MSAPPTRERQTAAEAHAAEIAERMRIELGRSVGEGDPVGREPDLYVTSTEHLAAAAAGVKPEDIGPKLGRNGKPLGRPRTNAPRHRVAPGNWRKR